MGTPKESKSISFVSNLLEPGMVAIDVGANIGYYTLVLAARLGPGGWVHAFEPTPALAERIRCNLALNGIACVKVNEVAVADTIGMASLQISSEDFEANSLSLFNADLALGRLAVSTMTLDTYVANQAINSIDFIKIDCEGFELNVLKGAQSLLQGPDAPMVLIEFNPSTLEECGTSVSELYEYLRSAAYDCYCLEQLRDEPAPVWNVFAAKQSHTEKYPVIHGAGLPKFDASSKQTSMTGTVSHR